MKFVLKVGTNIAVVPFFKNNEVYSKLDEKFLLETFDTTILLKEDKEKILILPFIFNVNNVHLCQELIDKLYSLEEYNGVNIYRNYNLALDSFYGTFADISKIVNEMIDAVDVNNFDARHKNSLNDIKLAIKRFSSFLETRNRFYRFTTRYFPDGKFDLSVLSISIFKRYIDIN